MALGSPTGAAEMSAARCGVDGELLSGCVNPTDERPHGPMRARIAMKHCFEATVQADGADNKRESADDYL